MRTIFLRVLEADDKGRALAEGARAEDGAQGGSRFEVDPASFASVPRSPFAYWASERMFSLFRNLDAFQGHERDVRFGASPKDRFRFVLANWEVDAAKRALLWMPLAKGGKRSPFYADIHLLLRWGNDARELKAHTAAYREVRGWGSHWTAALNGYELYGRPGLTWTLRTSLGFSMRAMPTGCVFADKGPAAFATGDDGDALLALLAVSNSSIFSACLELQLAAADAAARSYEVGIVQRTPVPEIVEESRCALAGLGRRAWSLKRTLDTHAEISHAFTLPALLQVPGADIEARVNARSQKLGEIEDELACIQSEIDERCFDLYEIDEADRRVISDGVGVGTSAVAAIEVVDDEDDVEAVEACEGESPQEAAGLAAELVSWAVGVAFGRFDIRLATAEREVPPEPKPFDPLPICSPGMLTRNDGFPATDTPDAYPLDWPSDGIMVDDAGQSEDLVARVRHVFEVVFGANADAWWEDCVQLLGGDLRRWLARDFFACLLYTSDAADE